MHRQGNSKTIWLMARDIVAAVCVLLLFATFAVGQITSGTISGSVKDPSGAAVPDATVVATDADKGVTRTVTTGASGEFVFPNLPPGKYKVTVELKGFKKIEKSDIIVNVADHVNAGELALEMGTTTESVTVTADAGQIQLQSNSGERSDLISNKQLEDVAMNGRNVLDYMKLIPGVISGFDGHASGTGGLDTMNINGTRANQHEFTLDGASNVDTGNNGGTHVTINPDAIEEVKILTSNYQAEFGKAAGGQIAIVTKGGTNEWHGDARFFHRNDSLNANEPFNKGNEIAGNLPNAPYLYRYNYIGYDIGGPIKKNKLFVFWNQEFYRQFVPITGTTQFYTPTALERKGDFSQSTDGAGNPVVLTGPGITNNKIDPSTLSPAQQAVFTNMEKLLSLFPLPNVSGFGVNGQNYNFSEALSANDPRREDILRVDYQLSDKYRFFVRWIHNADTESAPFTPFPGPFGIFACSSSINFAGGCTQQHPGWNLSVNMIASLTPTVVNEFSVGPSHTLSLAEGTNGNISLSKNGITMPLLYKSDTIPDISFGGLNNVSFSGPYLGATPWKQANTTVNVNDNLTWIRGVHTLKFGMFYQRNGKNQIAWGNINGQLNFGTGPTAPNCPVVVPPNGSCPYALGDPIASALLGSFDSFDQSTARPTGYFRYNQLEFYVQDTWKITQRLTLDYGMRFSWIPPQYDAKNQIAIFDPFSYNQANAVKIDDGGNIVPNSGNPLNGMKFTSGGGLPAGGWDDRGIMAEPRFGFAYDAFKDHKTVIRGGFGMMHDRVQGNLIFNTVFNNPALVQTASLGSGNIANLSSPSFGSGVLGNIVGASKDGHVPTVYSYSLGIQREVFKGATLDVAYVGNVSRHLTTARDLNQIPYGYAFTRAAQDPANFTTYCAAPQTGNPCTNGIPQVEPNLPAPYAAAGYSFSGIDAFGRPNYTNAPLVPYKGYGQISYLQWDGTSNYNSLQVSFQRRYSRGLTFGAVYTFSKALTTATSDQDLQDLYSPRTLDYRAAGWDRTHVFAANYIYDLPNVSKHLGGAKWLSYLTDHYQLSGVIQASTGTPVDLNNGFSFESGTLDGSNMWGAIPYYYTIDQHQDPVFPIIGTRIRGSRDFKRNPGMQNWDTSLFKNIPVGSNEKRSIQLRLETFNTFNHPNFATRNYSFNVSGPFQYSQGTPFSISQIPNWGTNASTNGTGVGGFRVVQLGAKFNF
ncbi:MAG: carboxypeptidase regulatory-like domain-containing protein [Candidatus Acidiferrum sp.]